MILFYKKNYWRYWGKADSENKLKYHCLVYHCLDVASVAATIIPRMGLAKYISKRLNRKYQTIESCIVFLCAVHDIGKFSNEFQGQLPELVKILRGISLNTAYQEKHWSSGYRFLCENIDKIFDGGKEDILDLFDSWISASSGHHGRPPVNQGGVSPVSAQFPVQVQQDALQFIQDAKSLFNIMDGDWKNLGDEFKMKEVSWQVAGLIVLADWIGSNKRWFPFVQEEMEIKQYWKTKALPQAERAVTESGILPLPPPPESKVTRLFPKIKNLTQLQNYAASILLSDKPQLFIFEDLTGSGKTEAALTLAHRMIALGCADGLYFGLPTMATANAMHERIGIMYRKLFAEGTNPSLILAHSASGQYLSLEKIDSKETADDDAEREAKNWLFDNRKKALLAHVGVGTIDQALLGILPVRHQSLRLLGIHRKVLIIDEVHAYDSYMNKLICTLLKFHAAQGGNAILLSATLPMKLRKIFLESFAEGRKIELNRAVILSNSYPLVTGIAGNGFLEKAIGTAKYLEREILVSPRCNEKEIIEFIESVAQKGKNICWIRNTVADAQETYEKLSRKYGRENIMLFHARFTLGDRLHIEKQIVSDFGENSGASSRKSKIIIATQVVEQSLDIDFDCMITDLVPIDLIIQRAGRLCRHSRDKQGNRIKDKDKRGLPELMLHMPKADGDISADWYKKKFPKAAGIYEHHGQLFLTASWLIEHKKFRMPQDARRMIESVYSEAAQRDIPPVLEKRENQADGADKAKAGLAQYNTLQLERGYMPDSNWHEDEKFPTRLGQVRTTVRLAMWEEKKLVPYFENDWRLSEVSVSNYHVAAEDDKYQYEIEKAKNEMPDKGKFCVVIPLQEKNGVYYGTAKNKHGNIVNILYDNKLGFRLQGEIDESD